MKKNRMMRAASALLVAVLMTTCTISGTFAKYTTSATSTDTARVAKWGFEPVAMDITGLFSKTYEFDATGHGLTGKAVESSSDVIAPGTWGKSAFAFAYDEAGGTTPEVAYSFKVSTTGSECHSDIQSNTNIKWALKEGAVNSLSDVTEWGSWTDLISKIEALDGNDVLNEGKNYNPGELPDKFTSADETYTVVWKWDFFVDDAGDTKDTAMGNANTLANVNLTITITATQID